MENACDRGKRGGGRTYRSSGLIAISFSGDTSSYSSTKNSALFSAVGGCGGVGGGGAVTRNDGVIGIVLKRKRS